MTRTQESPTTAVDPGFETKPKKVLGKSERWLGATYAVAGALMCLATMKGDLQQGQADCIQPVQGALVPDVSPFECARDIREAGDMGAVGTAAFISLTGMYIVIRDSRASRVQ